MAEYTEHYNLELPANAEHYDIKVANTNNKIIDEKLYEKVEKIPNKGLSTNDFTNGYKQKLDGLKNYDDTQIKADISNIQKEQITQNTDISNIKKEQETQNTNIEENNSKIVELQTEKAKLETELKEMQEDFYQASVRGQVSGEYIHVEDSSNCRARIEISGNSEQETRSGKNLLELMEGTYSNNGITAVVKDGVITLNGTATAISFVGINLLKSIELTNDKAYRLSAFNERTVGDGTNNYCSLRLNQDNIQVLFNTANVNSSITTNLKISYITIRTAQRITYNNFVVKPQLELGAGTNEWEQGGASPSPDYPSEIKTVGSNVNLLENTLKSQIINGIDVKVQDNGEIVLNGTATDNFALVIGKINKIKNMTFGGMCDGYGYSKMIAQIQGTDYNVNVVNSNKVALSDLDTEATVRLYIYKGAIIINAIIKPKIVEGTEVGEYSKFGQGCVKVTKCNTNLYDGKNEVGGINNDGSLSSTTDRWRTINYINVKSLKNLIIRVYDIETSGVLGRYCLYDDKYNFLSSAQILNTKTDLKVDNASYLKFWFLNEKVASSAQVQVQVEEGTTAKEYNKHEEQSYIMPTQAEMLEGDTFDFDNEEEVHTKAKLVLTGNENWKLESTGRFGIIKSDLPEIPAATSNDNDYLGNMCNSYKESTPVLTWKKVQGFCVDMSSCLRIYDDKYSTNNDLEGFKTYLKSKYDAGTPVVIYYKLQTPTRLKFTDEQKAVAKELNNARTYKNVTNITTDSKAILSLDYVKDLETLLTSKESEV